MSKYLRRFVNHINDLRKCACDFNVYFLVIHNKLAKIAFRSEYFKFLNIQRKKFVRYSSGGRENLYDFVRLDG